MNRVDGGDDGGGGRDNGRRYFSPIFLLFTSYFSLSFDFSPLSFLPLFFKQNNDIRIWRSFLGFMKRVYNKCEV